MANTYAVGARVRTHGEFRSITGELLDPSVVRVTYQTPALVETTKIYGTDAEVIRDGIGRYRIDIDVSAAGLWYYKWFSPSGVLVTADETHFIAKATQF